MQYCVRDEPFMYSCIPATSGPGAPSLPPALPLASMMDHWWGQFEAK